MSETPTTPAPELLSAEASRFLWVDCKPDEYSAILAAFGPLKQSHRWPMEKAYAAILTRFKQGNAALTARTEAAEEVAQQVKRGLEKAEAAYMAARELEEARTRRAEAHTAAQAEQIRLLTMQLTPGSTTERYPTVWAYEQACTALEAHRSRAAEAEAQVAMLRVELAEQERAKLLLIQETHRWSVAVKTLEAERIAKPDQEATCIFSGCKNGQVHDGACECYVNGRAQDLLNLFDL